MTNKQKITADETQRIIDKIAREYKKSFPIVLVNTELGKLEVVTRKGVSIFELKEHFTKTEMDKDLLQEGAGEWTPEHEVEMAVGNNFHRIHDSDAERWESWNAGKEVTK